MNKVVGLQAEIFKHTYFEEYLRTAASGYNISAYYGNITKKLTWMWKMALVAPQQKKNELFHHDFSKEFHKKFGEEIIPDKLFY